MNAFTDHFELEILENDNKTLPPRSSSQDEALQLCIKISTAIDRVEYMFTTEFEAEVEESESATLHQYYREAMIQGYNFAFEVTQYSILLRKVML